ncbi:uncharacterized protein MONOS_3596 [Monocercomonoides exilis]|uniref:uncharacterized protein n=1 Tax=Monocercomonoides exilis TaxID=2049356 RepID=UPI003559B741|nr:hypothetical protein MONOS_3596 [Monocercomonoides exilis]|eukprot:MONOS_3596.1-p1 / transcript=MONOS_3596.1 / gene=MONOS_3596 / organism=Monocercomonoides_exilis_PA203 / gene_product=unspecified product / transcript_product=unspecified product / location=Mono_scaffold00086:23785-31733(-) / protein_length=2353 / sequence_SO=supercontig / SO=protein_coding / is_pseudo=false
MDEVSSFVIEQFYYRYSSENHITNQEYSRQVTSAVLQRNAQLFQRPVAHYLQKRLFNSLQMNEEPVVGALQKENAKSKKTKQKNESKKSEKKTQKSNQISDEFYFDGMKGFYEAAPSTLFYVYPLIEAELLSEDSAIRIRFVEFIYQLFRSPGSLMKQSEHLTQVFLKRITDTYEVVRLFMTNNSISILKHGKVLAQSSFIESLLLPELLMRTEDANATIRLSALVSVSSLLLHLIQLPPSAQLPKQSAPSSSHSNKQELNSSTFLVSSRVLSLLSLRMRDKAKLVRDVAFSVVSLLFLLAFHSTHIAFATELAETHSTADTMLHPAPSPSHLLFSQTDSHSSFALLSPHLLSLLSSLLSQTTMFEYQYPLIVLIEDYTLQMTDNPLSRAFCLMHLFHLIIKSSSELTNQKSVQMSSASAISSASHLSSFEEQSFSSSSSTNYSFFHFFLQRRSSVAEAIQKWLRQKIQSHQNDENTKMIERPEGRSKNASKNKKSASRNKKAVNSEKDSENQTSRLQKRGKQNKLDVSRSKSKIPTEVSSRNAKKLQRNLTTTASLSALLRHFPQFLPSIETEPKIEEAKFYSLPPFVQMLMLLEDNLDEELAAGWLNVSLMSTHPTMFHSMQLLRNQMADLIRRLLHCISSDHRFVPSVHSQPLVELVRWSVFLLVDSEMLSGLLAMLLSCLVLGTEPEKAVEGTLNKEMNESSRRKVEKGKKEEKKGGKIMKKKGNDNIDKEWKDRLKFWIGSNKRNLMKTRKNQQSFESSEFANRKCACCLLEPQWEHRFGDEDDERRPKGDEGNEWDLLSSSSEESEGSDGDETDNETQPIGSERSRSLLRNYSSFHSFRLSLQEEEEGNREDERKEKKRRRQREKEILKRSQRDDEETILFISSEMDVFRSSMKHLVKHTSESDRSSDELSDEENNNMPHDEDEESLSEESREKTERKTKKKKVNRMKSINKKRKNKKESEDDNSSSDSKENLLKRRKIDDDLEEEEEEEQNDQNSLSLPRSFSHSFAPTQSAMQLLWLRQAEQIMPFAEEIIHLIDLIATFFPYLFIPLTTRDESHVEASNPSLDESSPENENKQKKSGTKKRESKSSHRNSALLIQSENEEDAILSDSSSSEFVFEENRSVNSGYSDKVLLNKPKNLVEGLFIVHPFVCVKEMSQTMDYQKRTIQEIVFPSSTNKTRENSAKKLSTGQLNSEMTQPKIVTEIRVLSAASLSNTHHSSSTATDGQLLTTTHPSTTSPSISSVQPSVRALHESLSTLSDRFWIECIKEDIQYAFLAGQSDKQRKQITPVSVSVSVTVPDDSLESSDNVEFINRKHKLSPQIIINMFLSLIQCDSRLKSLKFHMIHFLRKLAEIQLPQFLVPLLISEKESNGKYSKGKQKAKGSFKQTTSDYLSVQNISKLKTRFSSTLFSYSNRISLVLPSASLVLNSNRDLHTTSVCCSMLLSLVPRSAQHRVWSLLVCRCIEQVKGHNCSWCQQSQARNADSFESGGVYSQSQRDEMKSMFRFHCLSLAHSLDLLRIALTCSPLSILHEEAEEAVRVVIEKVCISGTWMDENDDQLEKSGVWSKSRGWSEEFNRENSAMIHSKATKKYSKNKNNEDKVADKRKEAIQKMKPLSDGLSFASKEVSEEEWNTPTCGCILMEAAMKAIAAPFLSLLNDLSTLETVNSMLQSIVAASSYSHQKQVRPTAEKGVERKIPSGEEAREIGPISTPGIPDEADADSEHNSPKLSSLANGESASASASYSSSSSVITPSTTPQLRQAHEALIRAGLFSPSLLRTPFETPGSLLSARYTPSSAMGSAISSSSANMRVAKTPAALTSLPLSPTSPVSPSVVSSADAAEMASSPGIAYRTPTESAIGHLHTSARNRPKEAETPSNNEMPVYSHHHRFLLRYAIAVLRFLFVFIHSHPQTLLAKYSEQMRKHRKQERYSLSLNPDELITNSTTISNSYLLTTLGYLHTDSTHHIHSSASASASASASTSSSSYSPFSSAEQERPVIHLSTVTRDRLSCTAFLLLFRIIRTTPIPSVPLNQLLNFGRWEEAALLCTSHPSLHVRRNCLSELLRHLHGKSLDVKHLAILPLFLLEEKVVAKEIYEDESKGSSEYEEDRAKSKRPPSNAKDQNMLSYSLSLQLVSESAQRIIEKEMKMLRNEWWRLVQKIQAEAPKIDASSALPERSLPFLIHFVAHHPFLRQALSHPPSGLSASSTSVNSESSFPSPTFKSAMWFARYVLHFFVSNVLTVPQTRTDIIDESLSFIRSSLDSISQNSIPLSVVCAIVDFLMEGKEEKEKKKEQRRKSKNKAVTEMSTSTTSLLMKGMFALGTGKDTRERVIGEILTQITLSSIHNILNKK